LYGSIFEKSTVSVFLPAIQEGIPAEKRPEKADGVTGKKEGDGPRFFPRQDPDLPGLFSVLKQPQIVKLRLAGFG
jgi:hypothetical protein